MAHDPALRDELVSMVTTELEAADAFFEAVAADPALESGLEGLLAGPVTPLIAALPGWDEAPPEAKPLLAVNARNVERIGAIVEADGWPGLRRVGANGADAAWLLAQHADRANGRRRSWLPTLAEAVDRGEADPRHLATLTDRIAAVDGERQRFGTIVLRAADGEVEFPLPVDAPAELERRRAEIGLVPLSAERPYLGEGDLVPFGPDRSDIPVNQWPILLEGHVSVEAALEAGVRRVHRVWAVRPGDRRHGRLRALARERGVTIDAVPADEIEALAVGRTHGGVIAPVAPRIERTFDSVLARMGEGSLAVMLDGIEDPFNYGQAVRALYAAGVAGVVVRRSWETATATVTRASAGTAELMPTARVASVAEASELARAHRYRVVCAVSDPLAPALDEVDLSGGVLLLVGGERRGVTRSSLDEADQLVRIAYGRERSPALGTATSAAILAFEALRQRRATREG